MTDTAVRAGQLSVPTKERFSAITGGVTIGKLSHPVVYVVALLLLYAFSFGHTSIMGWGKFTDVDGRYLDVYTVYVVSFIAAMCVVVLFSRRRLHPRVAPALGNAGIERRSIIVLAFAATCVSAMALKAGGFAVFAEDAMIFRRDSIAALGGYVGYPATLVTPLTAVFAWRFVETKHRRWAVLAVCCVLLQVAQINRQQIVFALAASLLAIYFSRRLSFGFLLAGLAGTIATIYALGVLAIFRRGGVEFFTLGVDAAVLPFHVVLEDLALAVKLAHYTTDVVGSGGFQGSYVIGYFVAVVVPEYGRNIGGTIVSQMLNADTSLSIGAPLSFFADGGMSEVIVAGIAQGLLAMVLYRKAVAGSIYARIGYALNFLNLLFHIRGGLVSFDPIWTYEMIALSFVFGLGNATGHRRVIVGAWRTAFVLTIPVSLIALAARF